MKPIKKILNLKISFSLYETISVYGYYQINLFNLLKMNLIYLKHDIQVFMFVRTIIFLNLHYFIN